jgi:beta-phosphoglucomutase
MPINTVIFDLEGTIADTESIWDEAAIEFLAAHGHIYDPSATRHLLMGGTIEQGARILRDFHGFSGDPIDLGKQRRDIITRLLEREVDFIPGFKEFHAMLAGDYHLGIATSMERPLLARLEKSLHLSQYFGNHIYSIEDIGFTPKPKPDIFLYAARRLGVEPASCLVIEDAPKGIQAAKAAGMRCIGITTSTTPELLAAAGADKVVDRFDEITV